MTGDVPFYHDHLQIRKDDHEISRVFLSTNEIRNANQRLITHLFQRIAVSGHQSIQQLKDW